MPERKFRLLLILTGAVLLTLAVLPATGWLLRLQVRSLALPGFITDNREARERRVAAVKSGDYPTQVAAILSGLTPMGAPSTIKVQRLTRLAERFPEEPSLYAHLLRFYTQGAVRLHREEQNELSAVPPVTTEKPKFSLPADLAGFDAAAAQGERLDPNNAFFPFMRAAGLYEAGRDADAIAAIHRAAQKTRYEDYTDAEFTVRDRFYTEAHGQQGSIARVSLAAAILFPHYAVMRGTARMNTVSAVHAELAGNRELGVQLRHDTMQIGGLMRVQGRYLIANLVGNAISAIPQGRPGGAPVVKTYDNDTTQAHRDHLLQEKREKYYAWLRSIGHNDEARFARAEMEAGLQAKEITKRITDESMERGPYSMRALAKISLLWAANQLTLANAFGMLLLGGMALLAGKVRPTTNLTAWRITAGLATFVLFALLIVNISHLVTNMYTASFQWINLQGYSMEDQSRPSERVFHILGITFALGCPLMLIAGAGLAGLKSRRSFLDNQGHWLRIIAVPTACGLLLMYSLMLVGTARQEAQLNRSLDQRINHEASYYATLIGVKWPGSVR